jgi:Rhodopirellula transposase DDE domain
MFRPMIPCLPKAQAPEARRFNLAGLARARLNSFVLHFEARRLPYIFPAKEEGESMSTFAVIKSKFESLRPALNERLCRLWAAVEARAIGRGGVTRVCAATRLSRPTVIRGLHELPLLHTVPAGLESDAEAGTGSARRRDHDRIRRPGAGAKPTEVKDPGVIAALEHMLMDEVAGDPMSEQRWVRSSLRHLSKRLTAEGHPVSAPNVARLLKEMGFSLKTNKRKQGTSGRCPERDEQFRYIASQRQSFAAMGLPIISVDTKKRELIGNFRNGGRAWAREAPQVDEHDFPSQAECSALPFGIYDTTRNKGYVVVGLSHNTPEFAVNTIAGWWQGEGRATHPKVGHLLILADGGGGNGSRSRAWKVNLQQHLCNRFQLTVSVCHYPPGCSKWNPVEHRLFSQISRNWEGKPLRTLGIMLGYIRGTTTTTGLTVTAHLDENTYRKGQKVSRDEIEQLNLKRHEVCPQWNYTISPKN